MRVAILLRAVNVRGTEVSMALLRDLLQRNGYRDVSTYLRSGNALASGAVKPGDIERLIEAEFGMRIDVITRSHAELQEVVAGNPFPEHADEGSKLAVAFCDRAPTGKPEPGPDESFEIRGKEVYLWFPDGMGRSKMFATLGRRLGVISTVRNWNSVLKLTELTGTLGP